MSEHYLGDGLYASCNGFSVKLRAPREGGDHEVWLEPDMMEALIKWWKNILDNQAEAAYERHQEHLMETGGGPTLQEQQQDAYKIKHGLPR